MEPPLSLANRAELIPSWLLIIECVVLLGCAPLALFLGIDVLAYLAGFVITAYGFGAFDILSLTRHQAQRAAYQALAIMLVIQLSLTFVAGLGKTRAMPVWMHIAAEALVIVGFAFFHIGVRSFLMAGALHVSLHLPQQQTCYSSLLEHYIALSGYPAVVVEQPVGGEQDAVATASARDPMCAHVSQPRRVLGSFNPLRFCDVALRLLPPDLIHLDQSILTHQDRPRRLYLVIKRGADFLASVVVLALSVPLWAFAVVGILLADGRPVFYSQPRVGQDRRPLRILKFRTLRSPTTGELEAIGDVGGRAFIFGSVLRRLRIDELPQLLMVIAGTMSLVGPRPEMAHYHDRSQRSIPYYEHRLKAKPGLSGWAQIRYTHTTTDDEYRDKTAFDLWYIAHRGLFLDIKIAFRTIGTLISRFGSR